MNNTLPTVDYHHPDAAKLFVESLRETGFGVLTNHPIPQDSVNGIYEHWLTFFNGDSKTDFAFSTEKFDGFFPAEQAEAAKGRTVRDIKEYYHYYPWGRCPQELQQEIKQYYNLACEFASTLLKWIEEQSPAEVSALYSEPLSDMMEGSQQSLLRILHYPPLRGDEKPDAIRALSLIHI